MARKKRRKNGASPQEMRRAAVRIADTDGMVCSIDKRRWEVASESSPESWYTAGEKYEIKSPRHVANTSLPL